MRYPIYIWAEFLKLKRTLAVLLALVAPVLPALIYVLFVLSTRTPDPAKGNPWLGAFKMSVGLYSALMLPFMVALQTAISHQQEHAHHGWKHLLALPISRSMLYASKFVTVMLLLTIGSFVLFLSTLAAGGFVGLLKPECSMFSNPIPWNTALAMAFFPLVSSSLIAALHHWVSFRWPGLAVALGLSICGMVGALLISQSPKWGRLYPWSLPMRSMAPQADDLGFILIYSLIAGSILFTYGIWQASRSEHA